MPDPLVVAFRECGPWCTGDAAEDARRAAAYERIYTRLHALARRMRGDGSAEDAASVVADRLLRSGPRGERPDDPYTTDVMVDSYLKRALRNALTDEVRRGVDHDELGPNLVAPIWAQDDTLEYDGARKAITRAVEVLFGAIAAGASESAGRAVQDRRDVAEGRKSFDQCVRERLGEVTGQTRNRFYQQQSRAMRWLVEAVESHIAANGLAVLDAWALRIVLGELRDADAGWRVTTEGA